MPYFLYLVRCRDNSLYCGITTDLKRRIAEHNSFSKKAAKYTRGRYPVKLVYWEKFDTRADASVREAEIKNWPKNKREELVAIVYNCK